MMMIEKLLREATERRASDLHITVGVPPVVRIHGNLVQMDYPRLLGADIEELFEMMATEKQREKFLQDGEVDFSYAVKGLGRFRVNIFRQRGSVAIVSRLIAERVPTMDELGYPETLKALTRKSRGLVLVTGPTGSGKSTTLAAMVDLINTERACHVITLEDPIEYLHKHRRSIVNQREINTDSASFASALRAAMREDPDVILVGEMRDQETISTAITAAETGHLVFATLHTNDAAQTIDRIIDSFPPYQQQQIRTQLSATLQGVIAQQLLPRADGIGREAALEILIATSAIRNLIREGKTYQIPSVIQTGSKFGMQTMDMALKTLYRRGLVAYDEVLMRASDQDVFARLLSG